MINCHYFKLSITTQCTIFSIFLLESSLVSYRHCRRIDISCIIYSVKRPLRLSQSQPISYKLMSKRRVGGEYIAWYVTPMVCTMKADIKMDTWLLTAWIFYIHTVYPYVRMIWTGLFFAFYSVIRCYLDPYFKHTKLCWYCSSLGEYILNTMLSSTYEMQFLSIK